MASMMCHGPRAQFPGMRLNLRHDHWPGSSSPAHVVRRYSRSLSSLSRRRDGFSVADSQAKSFGVNVLTSFTGKCQSFEAIRWSSVAPPRPVLLASSRPLQSWARAGTLFNSTRSGSGGNVKYASTESKTARIDIELDTHNSTSDTASSKILQRLPKLPIPTPTKHENIYTLPNFLTFTRLLAAPAVGYYILHSQPVAAILLFFYAGVTDAVDGYLARRYNSQTVVGTVIDPMADKALMTITVVCLTIQSILPLWLSVIILGRDVALAISAIYFRWISLPPPKTFSRYWDFSLPSAEVRPTEISKINTFLQLLLIGNAMLLPVLPEALVSAWNLTGVFEGWCYLVAGTTLWSGLSYVGNREAVKILSREEGEERKRRLVERSPKEPK